MSGAGIFDGATLGLLGGALASAALAIVRGRSGRSGAILAAVAVALGVAALGRLIGGVSIPPAVPGDLLPAGENPLVSLVAGLGLVALAIAGIGALGTRRPGALAGWFAVGHGGAALLVLATGGEAGLVAASVLIAVMALAVPGVVLVAPGPRAPRDGRPAPRILLALFLVSLCGLPPLGGFTARILTLEALIRSGFPVLALLITALGALPLVAAVRMLFELSGSALPMTAAEPRPGRAAIALAGLLTLAILLSGFLAEPLLDLVQSIWTVRGSPR